MADVLRVVVAIVVVGLLGRAARPAWRNRRLALLVWRRIRPVHVLGCAGLLALVLATAVGLMVAVPMTGYGVGSLIGLTGNAVFAPLEEATARGAAAGAGAGLGWAVFAGVAAFLGLLLALFPWLAYVEERVFREGLEDATLRAEVWKALRFGLAHLVMLIPVAAAVAIGVAGFTYGRVYRRAYARALAASVAHRAGDAGGLGPGDAGGHGPGDAGAHGPLDPGAHTRRRARDDAVLSATVWHTTFNSLVVLLVLAGVAMTVG